MNKRIKAAARDVMGGERMVGCGGCLFANGTGLPASLPDNKRRPLRISVPLALIFDALGRRRRCTVIHHYANRLPQNIILVAVGQGIQVWQGTMDMKMNITKLAVAVAVAGNRCADISELVVVIVVVIVVVVVFRSFPAWRCPHADRVCPGRRSVWRARRWRRDQHS